MRLSYAALALTLAACAAHAQYIAGTKIPETDVNHSVLGAVEAYRNAVEKGDAQALVLMASPKYSEDSGTPTIIDDYGFDGLQGVLASRFRAARDIRRILTDVEKDLPRGSSMIVRGQVESMTSAFIGLATGLLFAIGTV